MPIPFKSYKDYTNKGHEFYDFVICQKAFRDKLG